MKKWWILGVVLLICTTISFIYFGTSLLEQTGESSLLPSGPGKLTAQEQKDDQIQDGHKKVIMIIMDSMSAPLVNSAVEKGTMPALKFLMDHGHFYPELVSPFPTMSVTIESTLLTGKMPDKHHIPGLSWYSPDEGRLINYGTTFLFWMKNGFRQGIGDTLFNLNNQHLNPAIPTIFEELAKRGKTSGSVNLIVYRGPAQHRLQLPAWSHKLFGLPDTIETKGPHALAFGRFNRPVTIQGSLPDGLTQRLGLNDEYSARVVSHVIEQGEQPDFLLAFFPDFDNIAHRHGPHYRKGLEKTDRFLQEILNSYDSWEQALEKNIFIVLGDHGQDQLVEDKEQAGINLETIYADYNFHRLGEQTMGSDIAFGVNGRMSYVYAIETKDSLAHLASQALEDERVAFAAWLEGEWGVAQAPGSKQTLRFKPIGPLTDIYGGRWTIHGDEQILGLKLDQNKWQIAFTDFPDILNHLYTALKASASSTVVLTAKPGYSFKAEGISVHAGGGEHGGAHKHDVLAAMVVAGTDKRPEHSRIVDLKAFVLSLFELDDKNGRG
ncbi:putative AlkP superfamily pyrophosphatase or phosphodiesterase [Caldalkalibacillus uzonensis]|uniref:AlkP superfamily pyrophosphatase or phosphodiesterase n=1 Tax=Caldalkalibacillus uzonensis TaxID=353224 RepID=A0ABU0CP36_9BACI|nr:alkaline phosphatase family protein [Caldalkalibacillus uzonensis]MDQ0338159.1 putative AlkP superfamily pyrophosphatase or phosphodiesterase [Caldalkalibacillus uzonensis]